METHTDRQPPGAQPATGPERSGSAGPQTKKRHRLVFMNFGETELNQASLTRSFSDVRSRIQSHVRPETGNSSQPAAGQKCQPSPGHSWPPAPGPNLHPLLLPPSPHPPAPLPGTRRTLSSGICQPSSPRIGLCPDFPSMQTPCPVSAHTIPPASPDHRSPRRHHLIGSSLPLLSDACVHVCAHACVQVHDAWECTLTTAKPPPPPHSGRGVRAQERKQCGTSAALSADAGGRRRKGDPGQRPSPNAGRWARPRHGRQRRWRGGRDQRQRDAE